MYYNISYWPIIILAIVVALACRARQRRRRAVIIRNWEQPPNVGYSRLAGDPSASAAVFVNPQIVAPAGIAPGSVEPVIAVPNEIVDPVRPPAWNPDYSEGEGVRERLSSSEGRERGPVLSCSEGYDKEGQR